MKFKMPKGVFLKTYIAQIAIVTVAVIFTLAASYVYSVRTLKKNLNETNFSLTKQICENTENQLYNIDRQAMNFLDESNTVTFLEDAFRDNANRQLVHNAIQTRLSTIEYINENIRELYLYSDVSKRVITGETMGLAGDFDMEDWTEYIRSGSPEAMWYFKSNPQGGTDAVLIRPYISTGSIGTIRGYIAAVLKGDEFFEGQLEKIDSENPNTVCFFDKKGNAFFNGGEPPADFEEVSGDDQKLYRKNNKLVYHEKGEYSGWQYVNVSENGSGPVGNLIMAVVCIGIVVLIISLACILLFSRYTIKPIDDLLKDISAKFSKAQNAPGPADDIESLNDMFQSILSDRINMQDQIRRAAPALKWRLLSDVVEGNRTVYEEILPYFNMVGIRLYPKNYIVAVVEADSEDAIEQSVMDKLCAFVDDLINQGEDKGAAFRTGKNSVVALMSYLDDYEDLLLSGFAIGEMIKEHAKEYGITVSVGIGKPYEEMAQIKNSYSEAVRALKYKIMSGGDIVIAYQDIADGGTGNVMDYIKGIDKIISPFVQNKRNEAEEEVSGFFDTMIANKIQPEIMRQLAMQIMNDCIKTMNMTGSDMKELEDQGFYRQYYRIMQIKDADEIRKCVQELLNALIDRKEENMKRLRENKSNSAVVEKMTEYIGENYMDKDLSLNKIADEFKLSDSHVSRIFKEYSGVKLMNYIIAVRIDKAKELLENTDDKISKIADDVGYSHTSFLRIFKQCTGMTPTEYRNKTE